MPIRSRNRGPDGIAADLEARRGAEEAAIAIRAGQAERQEAGSWRGEEKEIKRKGRKVKGRRRREGKGMEKEREEGKGRGREEAES